MNSRDAVDEAGERYEAAEAAFLQGLRDWPSREQLIELADAVAEAASAWYAEGMEAWAASSGANRDALELETDKTEVLSDMWRDVARSFHGLPALGY